MRNPKRTYWLATAGVVILFLPALLSGCYLACIAANPMVTSLTITQEIVNESSETVTVRPLYRPGGQWRTIHSALASWLILPALSGPDYVLEPTERVAVHKVDDRSILCGILITLKNGDRRFYERDMTSRDDDPLTDPWQYPKAVSVHKVHEMPPPPPELLAACNETQMKIWRDRIVAYVFFTTPFIFFWCLRVRKRAKRAMECSPIPRLY